jgi:hypothetical protein
MKTATIAFAAAVLMAAAGASAQTPAATDRAPIAPTACKQQLADFDTTWREVMPFSPGKPSQAQVMGRKGHAHTGIDYNYMSLQMRLAGQDCNAGREHEAMLRMDVVRSIMKLPEVAHPATQPVKH